VSRRVQKPAEVSKHKTLVFLELNFSPRGKVAALAGCLIDKPVKEAREAVFSFFRHGLCRLKPAG
jgi:hypothetical protein